MYPNSLSSTKDKINQCLMIKSNRMFIKMLTQILKETNSIVHLWMSKSNLIHYILLKACNIYLFLKKI